MRFKLLPVRRVPPLARLPSPYLRKNLEVPLKEFSRAGAKRIQVARLQRPRLIAAQTTAGEKRAPSKAGCVGGYELPSKVGKSSEVKVNISVLLGRFVS